MKLKSYFRKKFKALETVLYFRQYSLFFRFYILILMIVIILIVAFSVYISNLLSGNEAARARQINEQMAARTASQMDNSIYFLNQILSVAGTNRYVIDAAVRPGLIYADRNQNVVAFMKDIPKNNVFINKIWLYEMTDNLVFVSDGAVSPFEQYSSANVLEAIMRLAKSEEGRVIGAAEKSQSVITLLNGEIYIVYSALRSVNGEYLFKLIAKVNTPRLIKNTVKEVENAGYGIEVSSASGALLYSNLDQMDSLSADTEITLCDTSLGLTYTLHPLQFASSDWLYITRQAIPFIAAAAFFSMLMALLLAEKMYAPISKVTKNVLKTGGAPPQSPKCHDEMGFLYQTYSSILHDKRRAEYLIQDIRPELEKQLFLQLMNGAEFEESALEQRLSDIHSEFRLQGVYQVMMLCYVDLGESGDVASYLSIREIERGVEALFPAKSGQIRYISKGSAGVIVLQHPPGTEEAIRAAEAAFEAQVRLLLQAQGVRALTAWGNPREGLREMPPSYQEASGRLKRLIYLQNDGEQGGEDGPGEGDVTQEYFAKKIDDLKSMVTSSDIDSAENCLNQLLEEFRGQDVDLAQRKQAYGLLLDTLIEKSLQFPTTPCYCSTEDYQEMYRTLEICSDQARLSECMEANALRIFSFVRSQLLRRQNRIVEKAKEYISENYGNGDLSAQMIAGSIGISPSYLSNLFTTQTGESLVAYINEYRVHIAIHLLQSTSISIKEIGFRTGFNTSQNFNRVFKRVTGKTPGKYREKGLGQ